MLSKGPYSNFPEFLLNLSYNTSSNLIVFFKNAIADCLQNHCVRNNYIILNLNLLQIIHSAHDQQYLSGITFINFFVYVKQSDECPFVYGKNLLTGGGFSMT